MDTLNLFLFNLFNPIRRLMYYAAALGFFRNTSNVTIRAALSKLASSSTRKASIVDDASKSCSCGSVSTDILWWSNTEPSSSPASKASRKSPDIKNPGHAVSSQKQTTGSLFSLLAFIEAIVPLASSPIVAWLYTTSLSWY